MGVVTFILSCYKLVSLGKDIRKFIKDAPSVIEKIASLELVAAKKAFEDAAKSKNPLYEVNSAITILRPVREKFKSESNYKSIVNLYKTELFLATCYHFRDEGKLVKKFCEFSTSTLNSMHDEKRMFIFQQQVTKVTPDPIENFLKKKKTIPTWKEAAFYAAGFAPQVIVGKVIAKAISAPLIKKQGVADSWLDVLTGYSVPSLESEIEKEDQKHSEFLKLIQDSSRE